AADFGTSVILSGLAEDDRQYVSILSRLFWCSVLERQDANGQAVRRHSARQLNGAHPPRRCQGTGGAGRGGTRQPRPSTPTMIAVAPDLKRPSSRWRTPSRGDRWRRRTRAIVQNSVCVIAGGSYSPIRCFTKNSGARTAMP